MLLLSPLTTSRPGRRARLQRIVLERSLAGLTYMEGGALGFVSAGLEHQTDLGSSLAIKRCRLHTMDKLMEQLELGNHTDGPVLVLALTCAEYPHS